MSEQQFIVMRIGRQNATGAVRPIDADKGLGG
jgi:hypothetical protein